MDNPASFNIFFCLLVNSTWEFFCECSVFIFTPHPTKHIIKQQIKNNALFFACRYPFQNLILSLSAFSNATRVSIISLWVSLTKVSNCVWTLFKILFFDVFQLFRVALIITGCYNRDMGANRLSVAPFSAFTLTRIYVYVKVFYPLYP